MVTKRLTKKKHSHHEASVPDMEYFNTYIGRTFNDKSEFDLFDYGLDSNTNILIEGPTGPGKTSAVLAYSAMREMAFYAIPSNIGIEPSQLFGKFIPDEENGGFKWIDGPVTSIVRNGGVLLINEVNFMPERVATVLFGLLDKRRQIILLDHEAEVIDAHEDLLIIADMNPDYEGTRTLNKAFRNRFGIQLFWDYDPTVEAALVESKSLLSLAGRIRNDVARGLYQTPVSTNMLQEFERITEALGIDFAVTNFVNHFATEERAPIKQLVITFKDNIVRDLKEAKKKAKEDPETEGLESTYDDEHPIWKIREEAKDGYVDPEWGVKGEDWVWNEESDTVPETDEGETVTRPDYF